MYDTLHKIWIPATLVHVLPKDNYQVHASNGVVYHCLRQHLCECSVKPTDTTSDVTVAMTQAPARPHISVPLPAPTKSAQLPQPLLVAPPMPAIPKPLIPAIPKVTPVPALMSATSSAAPVQPRDQAMPASHPST